MKIKWEESALVRMEKIQAYLVEEFGLKVSEDFGSKTIEIIEALTQQPNKGQVSTKNKEVRKIHLSKTVVAFYTVIKKQVVILDFFDQRQHPDKSKY